MKKSPSVLIVTSNFPRWQGDSTPPFVHTLAQDLIRLGWHVDVLAPHAQGAAVSENLDGVPVSRFRYLWPEALQTVCYDGGALSKLNADGNRLKVLALVAAQFCAILGRARARQFDLLHSHWLLPQGLTCEIAATMVGVPHVATVHGGDVFALRGKALSTAKRFVLRGADAVTVNSSATAKIARDLAGAAVDLHCIPMGASERPAIDEQAAYALRKRLLAGGSHLLIFVGRLVEEKGPFDLLEALPLLGKRLHGVRAVFVGDGPARTDLLIKAKAVGLDQSVVFEGWRSAAEIPIYLAAADVFVGPSKMAASGWIEAQGLTFIEAMMAGTPVVAAACGGIVDSVIDGETGLLVPQGAPGAIADAVFRILDDHELAQGLAARAREYAEKRFTRSASAEAFSRLYSRLLASSGGSI